MARAMDVDAPYLEERLCSVSILALRMSSRKRLGMYLNMEAIPLHDGLLPNYQGLAECIGFDFIEQQKFQRDRDPTQSLLMEWGNQPGLEPALGKLVEYLQKLERVDVLEDCIHIISKLCKLVSLLVENTEHSATIKLCSMIISGSALFQLGN